MKFFGKQIKTSVLAYICTKKSAKAHKNGTLVRKYG